MINISKSISERYPYPPIRETINGKDVSITGVVHSKEFFERYKPFFEEIIFQHDIIILEGVWGTEFWGDYDFYRLIGTIAYSKNKRIYQVDPVNLPVSLIDYAQCFIGLRLILLGLPKTRSEISRKEFLKLLGGLAIKGFGTSLVFGSLPGIWLRGLMSKEILIEYGVDDLLTYGKTDFKNLMVAHGIDRICYEIDEFTSLVSLHGYTHYETVDAYLRNPVLREKRFVYLPYDLVGERNIREYVPYENGWVKEREF
ncbi:hypothetical protein A3K72_03480 [Candidatus Woesearchaeota archaeon RBG_13_36_6]|nr:MAG: hypothetical protein A3K72_03480 [Candidatus Woesearchaeota archaeon RBG_13_36_6]